jgi:hypothetical protein
LLTARAPAGQGRVVLRRVEAGAGKAAVIARWVAGLAATYALKPRGL